MKINIAITLSLLAIIACIFRNEGIIYQIDNLQSEIEELQENQGCSLLLDNEEYH